MGKLSRNARPIQPLLAAWAVFFAFTGLFTVFIYRVVMSENPRIGSVVFDASTTNLILSIASQLYAMLLGYMLNNMLDAVRWELVSSTKGKGTSFLTFLQLSPAIGYFTLCYLTATAKLSIHRNAGLFKLAIPFMALGFGSILKFQSSFTDSLVGTEVGVFAGVVPLDTNLLGTVPPSTIVTYLSSWIEQLLHYPRFTIPWEIEGCEEEAGCEAYFLPGGLEGAVLGASDSNHGLLLTALPDGTDSVRIENAQGLALTFENVSDPNTFDARTDCKIILIAGDGFQVCGRQVGPSVMVGWHACPQDLYDDSRCNETQRWADPEAMQMKLLMTTYQLQAATLYNVTTWDITGIEWTSSASALPVIISDYNIVWNMLSDRAVWPDDEDTSALKAFFYQLTWLYRTYGMNKAKLRQHLQNFLAARMQFGTMVWLAANGTYGHVDNTTFTLPPYMYTTATCGKLVQIFKPQRWTPWVFLFPSWILIFVVGMPWVRDFLGRDEPIPKGSGILEIDILARSIGQDSSAPAKTTEGESPCVTGFGDFVKDLTPKERSSVRLSAGLLRNRRVLFKRPESEGHDRGGTNDKVLMVVRQDATNSQAMMLECREREAARVTSTDSSPASSSAAIRCRSRASSLP